MPKFLFIYHGENSDHQLSPEEMQQVMEVWMNWINKGMAEGWLVDPGDALAPTGKMVDANLVVTDGPFAESKEVVGGYSVVQTETIEQAVELAKGCPVPSSGGRVEVRQMLNLAAASES